MSRKRSLNISPMQNGHVKEVFKVMNVCGKLLAMLCEEKWLDLPERQHTCGEMKCLPCDPLSPARVLWAIVIELGKCTVQMWNVSRPLNQESNVKIQCLHY